MQPRRFILSLLLAAAPLFSAFAAPPCYDRKNRMEFNDSMVLSWREYMENKFTARAFIKGKLVLLMEDRQNHVHFEVDLDEDLNTPDDRVEVIYNTKYGPLPDFQPGDEVIACGDFVADPYSPHRAVIHWLHLNPKKGGPHEDGYLAINGHVTGLTLKKKEQ